jgi:hypothetical protein
MMETAGTSETSVNFYKTTQRNNPDDSHLQGTVELHGALNVAVLPVLRVAAVRMLGYTCPALL